MRERRVRDRLWVGPKREKEESETDCGWDQNERKKSQTQIVGGTKMKVK